MRRQQQACDSVSVPYRGRRFPHRGGAIGADRVSWARRRCKRNLTHASTGCENKIERNLTHDSNVDQAEPAHRAALEPAH